MYRYLTLLLSLFVFSQVANAQFELIGDAEYMSGNCIRLTPDYQYREGIAYYQTKLDLSNYFEITFDIFFGANDEGADGITFVIHNDPRGYEAYGTWGECMGYGRWSPSAYWANSITPSIAVEFDTYQNPQQNDPWYDHIAYLENGISFHESHWNNNEDDFNIEDNFLHDFRFSWNPETQTIKVTLDGKVVHTGQRDLINDIFEGNTQVIWGFTASTGRKSNLQYFCLRTLAQQHENAPENIISSIIKNAKAE
ncbi:L-type lectin-domain containing protein [Chondrinema litorale]|uniref:L-type lectin-domain containing protein n=1 Tax=Chondrinema litorale TaxID=2994555 RepID=UPI002542BB55|nr:L-type lectin-domain containing protein [Chondrinema litorale]UZR92791.1 L-type lectin-domain containing protein [Chondrinema litorale]